MKITNIKPKQKQKKRKEINSTTKQNPGKKKKNPRAKRQSTHDADIDFVGRVIGKESFGNTEDRILGSRLHVAPPRRGHGSRSSEQTGAGEATRRPGPNEMRHWRWSLAEQSRAEQS